MSQLQPHFLDNKRIVVAGAGISGLAFAISLHKVWPFVSSLPPPKITLYERDASAVPPGREGYSLSLRSDHPSAGIQTLQKMGLLDEMLSVSITALGEEGGEGGGHGGFVVWDKDFKTVMKIRSKTPKGCPVSGMRIHRGNLRRTLVEAVASLPGVEIHWATPIMAVSASADGCILIEHKQGVDEADVLIAADGSSSKLRSLLRPEDGLTFAKPTCINGTAPLSHTPAGRRDEFGTVISGRGDALFIAPIDKEKMLWSLSWYAPAPISQGKPPLPTAEIDALIEEARSRGGASFGDRFLKMLDETDRSSLSRFNAMDKQPFSHSGPYITNSQFSGLAGRVVFLGDANHAVSPFAGNGANLALMDGWDFAESLVKGNSLQEAIQRYDALAMGRARKVVSMSHFTIRVMHAQGWSLWIFLWVLRIVRWLFLGRTLEDATK